MLESSILKISSDGTINKIKKLIDANRKCTVFKILKYIFFLTITDFISIKNVCF